MLTGKQREWPGPPDIYTLKEWLWNERYPSGYACNYYIQLGPGQNMENAMHWLLTIYRRVSELRIKQDGKNTPRQPSFFRRTHLAGKEEGR